MAKPPPNIFNEVDALWEQLQGRGPSAEKAAGDALLASTVIDDPDPRHYGSTQAFELKYERHAGPPQPTRVTQAYAILDLARKEGWSGANGGPADPVQGDPGGSTECPTGTQAFTPTTGGCTNPLAAGHFELHRTDDGVDYAAVGSPQPLLAICDMTIIRSSDAPGWGPGSSFIYAKLTSGPFAGKCWYYAEHLDKNDLPTNGKKLKAGDHVATLVPGGWDLEVGFAKADHLAATSVGVNGYPSVSGIAAAKFLRSLGAQTREDPGPGPAVYGGESCR